MQPISKHFDMIEEPSTVVVALSGGVDSALAAALLREKGWHVRCLHFLLPGFGSKGEEKVASAQRIAESLQVPLSVVDMKEQFSRLVIEPFIEIYLQGLTPNPCVVCNPKIKFDGLLRYAKQEGIEYVATGHYARVRKAESGLFELWRGKDKGKEQSYFLHRLDQNRLSKTVFPLENLFKAQARALAAKLGLPPISGPESQEICFLSGNDYRMLVESKRAEKTLKKGDIIDREGRKVGEHLGTYRYTIGQRHGLGIASESPYYVMEIRPHENQVVVARKEELFSKELEANDFNWIAGSPPARRVRVQAQVRYRHQPSPGWLEFVDQKRVRFSFDQPQWAITPGQALVCYDGDRVLGGGWITK